MDHKETMSDNVEVRDRDDVHETGVFPQQKTTKFMVFFSLYIALAGWIYNFDLGKLNTLTYSDHASRAD
jgi:hypothetical protein